MAQITISVDNSQWPDFKKYYLKRLPVPLEAEVPIMSDGDWIKNCIVTDIYQVLGEGKQMEAFNELDINIVIS